MVHDQPITTTRLASTAVIDLRAARACVDVTHDCIAIALDKRDTRLGEVPPGQLVVLSTMTAALEVAAARVLLRVDPNAAQVMSTVIDLCRGSLPPRW